MVGRNNVASHVTQVTWTLLHTPPHPTPPYPTPHHGGSQQRSITCHASYMNVITHPTSPHPHPTPKNGNNRTASYRRPYQKHQKEKPWKNKKTIYVIVCETVLSLEQLILTKLQPICFWEAEGSFASNGRSFMASVPNAHLEARANCRSPRTPQCSVCTGSIS